jgi:polysaccharide pyruvyl transferase WcaK-like protein
MRYHAMVLSVQESVPFLGICYDWKSISLMQELGLSELAVQYFREPQSTDDLTAEKAGRTAA